MNTAILDRTAERIRRITGDPIPVVSAPGNAVPMPANDRTPPSPACFEALERMASYWRGRASGRQAAIDFHRGEACQRLVTVGVDVSHDLLRDHACIAEYEKRAEAGR
jgi:hypothetical protein